MLVGEERRWMGSHVEAVNTGAGWRGGGGFEAIGCAVEEGRVVSAVEEDGGRGPGRQRMGGRWFDTIEGSRWSGGGGGVAWWSISSGGVVWWSGRLMWSSNGFLT
ncbi:hypothetical protein R6Q59_003150 [Mikania micrantha]